MFSYEVIHASLVRIMGGNQACGRVLWVGLPTHLVQESNVGITGITNGTGQASLCLTCLPGFENVMSNDESTLTPANIAIQTIFSRNRSGIAQRALYVQCTYIVRTVGTLYVQCTYIVRPVPAGRVDL